MHGENLNYIVDGKNEIYSEVAVKDFEIAGYIMIGYGDKSNNKDYLSLMKRAKAEEKPFEYVDINKLREEHGLEDIDNHVLLINQIASRTLDAIAADKNKIGQSLLKELPARQINRN
jgi:NAD(P)H-nitrite reductase large subunit